MKLFDWFDSLLSGPDTSCNTEMVINPASGLPMCGAIDTAGNPYGVDLHSTDHDTSPWDSGSPCDSTPVFDSGISSCDTGCSFDSGFSGCDTSSSFDTGTSSFDSSSSSCGLNDW